MKAGMLGFGTVGAATVESFVANQDLIRSKTANAIEFTRVATRTPARAQGRVPAGCVVSDDCRSVVDDPQIEVVVELTGDVAFGWDLVLRALANGKHVVTANKALLALHGDLIMLKADQARRSVLFEGAVAVSIPIVKVLKEAAAANRITSVTGVLNGTSNYVLSQMVEHGVEFAAALADAQGRGYAEADPTMDVNGEDAAHKLTLLASLAFGVPIDFSRVRFKGITDLHPVDTAFAKRLGYQIKLIAQAKLAEGDLILSVQPTLVPNSSMLARVGGAMNGIALQGDLLGSAFLYGSGAGGRQTASAILADLVELANRSGEGRSGGAHNVGFRPDVSRPAVGPCRRDRADSFYIRSRLDDEAGALAKVSAVLAGANISVNMLLQDRGQGALSDLVVITHAVSHDDFHGMLLELRKAAGLGHDVVVHPVLSDCDC